jgi:hypothetical protein
MASKEQPILSPQVRAILRAAELLDEDEVYNLMKALSARWVNKLQARANKQQLKEETTMAG